jgi:hypothetical protein
LNVLYVIYAYNTMFLTSERDRWCMKDNARESRERVVEREIQRMQEKERTNNHGTRR